MSLKIEKKAIAALVAALCAGVGATQNASAAALAQSVFDVTAFSILKSDGSAFNPATDFDRIVASNSGIAAANLSGFPSISSGPLVSPFAIDVPAQCLGACPFANNDFSHHIAPPVLSQYSRGDALLSGNALTPGGANASTLGEVSLTSKGVGASSATLGVSAEFSFSLTSDQKVRFAFNALPYLFTFLDANTADPRIAQASLSWNIEIDLLGPGGSRTQVFDWSPNGLAGGIVGGTELSDPCTLNTTRAVLSPGTSQYNPGACNGYLAETDLLLASNTYSLTLHHDSFANATFTAPTKMPEPGTILIMGAGLLGLGLVQRRRSGKK